MAGFKTENFGKSKIMAGFKTENFGKIKYYLTELSCSFKLSLFGRSNDII